MNLLTLAWGAKVFSFNLPQVFGSNKNFRHMVWQYKVAESMDNEVKYFLMEYYIHFHAPVCLFVCFFV